jgi:hypothetical protein
MRVKKEGSGLFEQRITHLLPFCGWQKRPIPASFFIYKKANGKCEVMKKIILGAIISLSLVSFKQHEKATGVEDKIYGIWQGAFGEGNDIKSVVVSFLPDQTMEFNIRGNSAEEKVTGSFAVQGDTAIVLNYVKDGISQVRMIGSLNKTKNFVDGVWETGGQPKGSFYLQKQKAMVNYAKGNIRNSARTIKAVS